MKKGLIAVILPGLFAGLFISPQAFSANDQYCSHYARQAVIQHINNLKHKCDFTGLRWNPHYIGQKRWCKGVRQVIAERENQFRANQLKNTCRIPANPNVAWRDMSYWQREKIIEDVIEVVKKDDIQSLRIFNSQKVDFKHEWGGNWGTPLYHAIDHQSVKSVHYLIQFDNPNRTTNAGPNPLTNLLKDNTVNYKLLNFLLQKGSKPNGAGEANWNSAIPLSVSINKGDIRAVRVLLRFGADPNGFFDDSLLIEAIKKRSLPIVSALIRQGAKVNDGKHGINCQQMRQSKTVMVQLPLDVANRSGYQPVIQLLKRKGAKTAADCAAGR